MGNEIIPPKVVIPLHGIRTHAEWQRAFVTLTQEINLENLREHLANVFYCPFDEWSFGYFWLPSFLNPRKREQKIQWFRNEYRRLLESKYAEIGDTNYPSVVSHSFGTYIVGQALIRYEYIKLRKIILCGSMLSRSFPWKMIMDRGQVLEVRNEYGTKDIWVRCAGYFVEGAGSSGYNGFDVEDTRIVQKQFLYKHSEYFEKEHMRNFWIPFLIGVSPNSESVLSSDFYMEALSKTMSNPRYEDDIRRFDRIFDRASIIDMETIIIVVGKLVPSELLDRPVAEHLRDQINYLGKVEQYPFRRAIVLTDEGWYAEPDLANNAVIAIGGPGVNKLSAEFDTWEAPPGSREGKYTLIGSSVLTGFFRKNARGLPQVALWGNTASRTREAVESYVKNEKGLSELLRLVWTTT